MSENPFVKPGAITSSQLVKPKLHDGGYKIVVLDRVEHGVQPAYCTHGKSTCHGCDDWCWLGDHTYELVASGEAMPMCQECAAAAVVEWIAAGKP